MSEYNIKANDTLALMVGDESLICHVQSIDGVNAELKSAQELNDEEVNAILNHHNSESFLIANDKGKTDCSILGCVSKVDDDSDLMIRIKLIGDTQYPNELAASEPYMIYSCPTQDDINNFLDESGSSLKHVPEGDSIYGLFFALFKEQDKRIQELERALSIQSDTKVSH